MAESPLSVRPLSTAKIGKKPNHSVGKSFGRRHRHRQPGGGFVWLFALGSVMRRAVTINDPARRGVMMGKSVIIDGQLLADHLNRRQQTARRADGVLEVKRPAGRGGAQCVARAP